MKKIILLGEHDKGLGIPFSESTVSGRRLRKIINPIPLQCHLGNVFKVTGEPIDLNYIYHQYDIVVALGRKAEAECIRQGVNRYAKLKYLPHPATRNSKGLKILKDGLMKLMKGQIYGK